MGIEEEVGLIRNIGDRNLIAMYGGQHGINDHEKNRTTYVSFTLRYPFIFLNFQLITTRGYSNPSGSRSRATNISRKRSCSNAVGRFPVLSASFINSTVVILCILSSNTISFKPYKVFRYSNSSSTRIISFSFATIRKLNNVINFYFTQYYVSIYYYQCYYTLKPIFFI